MKVSNHEVMITAFRDMQDEGLNISVLQMFITKRTGIYSIDSLVFGNYVVRRFQEDE